MVLHFTFLLFAVCALGSCIKQENGQFQREFRMSLELPADANPLFTHIFEKRIESSWLQFLKENNLTQAEIRMVRPRSAILSPVFNNSISYDLIAEGHVLMYPVGNLNQNLPIAEIYDPVGTGNELVFLPGLADVKDIISQAEFVLRLSLNIRATPTVISEHYLTVQFDVFL